MLTTGSGAATGGQRSQSSAPQLSAGEAPWMAAPPLPVPEDPLRHAYVDRGRIRSCSPAELRLAVRDDSAGSLGWVWDPGSSSWTRVEHVPWLFDDLRARATASLQRMRRDAAQFSGLLLIPLVFEVVSGSQGTVVLVWLLAMLGLLPVLEHSWDLYRMRSDVAGAVARSARESSYLVWLGRQPCRGTWLLLYGIALVGAVQLLAAMSGGEPASILAAGVVKNAIRGGEWWRALTGTLLHGGVLHFGLNALSLLSLGKIIEATFGWPYVPLVFLLAAVTGSVCSLILLPEATSVGASGGILGMLGFVLTVTWNRTPALPELLSRALLRSALYCAVGGIVAYPIIDNAGHLGGFVAGAVLGFALARLGRARAGGDLTGSVKLAGAAASGVILAGIAVAIFAMLRAAFPAGV